MLEKVDLGKKVSKREYKRLMPDLRARLYGLQKASWDAKIPVAIIFEGWDAAGKGTSIQALTAPLDPRGFKLYPVREARTYEKKRPWLWRFWIKLPGRGEWAIFDRSWYGRVMVERVEEITSEKKWRRAYRDIVDFERTIADDGCLIIKFFLHISKREQKRRFKRLLKDPLTAWHVLPEDWEHHARYEEYALAYEEAFERTDTEWGPWTIVEATDRRHTRVKVFQTIIDALEERLGTIPGALPPLPAAEEVAPEASVTPAGAGKVPEGVGPARSAPADGKETAAPARKPRRRTRASARAGKPKQARRGSDEPEKSGTAGEKQVAGAAAGGDQEREEHAGKH